MATIITWWQQFIFFHSASQNIDTLLEHEFMHAKPQDSVSLTLEHQTSPELMLHKQLNEKNHIF